MSKKYLLPELDIAEGSVEGNDGSRNDCWEEVPDAFEFLLDHLVLTYESTESVFDGGSNGTPHVFEQMLIFNKAFFDEAHPEHARAVAEWKAVLCIMALRFVKNIPLRMYRVDLSEEQVNPFLIAAKTFQLNEEPILRNTTWDFIYVLSLGDDPIAITSPISVICPARMFKSRINKNEISDWISVLKVSEVDSLQLEFGGNGYEYQVIVQWLDVLSEGLYSNGNRNPEMLDKYNYIKEQIADLKSLCQSRSYGAVKLTKKSDIYSEMKCQRKEFSFLNFCYDFVIENKKLEFLKDKHVEDIFCDRMLLLAYDESPESIYLSENIGKLREIIHNVLSIEGRSIVSVFDETDAEMALVAFLPLKKELIEELEAREITPEELFESCRIVFDTLRNKLCITLVIKEFPYEYQKNYSYDSCEKVYAEQLPAVYMWPPKRIRGIDWKVYYTYYEKRAFVEYAVTGKETVRWDYTAKSEKDVPCDSFVLFQSESYPSYIRVLANGAGGYLPISVDGEEICATNESAQIYLDMGHTTTSMALLKEKKDSEEPFERILLQPPVSECMIGMMGDTDGGSGNTKKEEVWNFFSSLIQPVAELGNDLLPESQYFINRWNSYMKYDRNPAGLSISPLESGLPMMGNEPNADMQMIQNQDFLCISYRSMQETERKKVHGYLEALLTLGAYEAVKNGCNYMQVYFLYDPALLQNELGEYINLYEDAIRKVYSRTGLNPVNQGGYERMDEGEALLYSICYREKDGLRKDVLYTGVDIGWEKSIIENIEFEKDEKVKTVFSYDCTENSTGGRSISFLLNGISFLNYHKMLGVMLGEPYGGAVKYWNLLEKFSKLYTTKPIPNEEYYHGLYSMIMKNIEKEDFRISPDLYNKHKEFRLFLKLFSFQMIALLLEVGLTIGYQTNQSEDPKEIKVYLGGNGAKFVRWIMNLKKRQGITEDNEGLLFILDMNHSIPSILKKAYRIGQNKDVDFSGECSIEIFANPKCQLLEGYIVKNHQEQYLKWDSPISSQKRSGDVGNSIISEYRLRNLLNESLKDVFGNDLENLCNEVMKSGNVDTNNKISLEQAYAMVQNISKRTADEVTQKIDNPLNISCESGNGQK